MRTWRRRVDELSADLPPADRAAVRNTIANNVLSGWHPSDDAITRLVDFAAGQTSAADYLTHITQTAQHRHC
ncbi:hypothetical protein [Mycobacterium intracellulare]|uniref:antitoxin VbhA family protein n=1 Tax=Mycobacterium intracellulare TaxID=1767 RepID=UPI000ADDA7B2|nr:hypothetical protein [Mycobacterium intracellulare]